jgi:uncharacterized protein YcgL (UPF0745 family)
MECKIYKGKRKHDHYLFTEAGQALDSIPESILQIFGDLERVMTIDITSETVLAQSDPEEVIRMIEANGFFIQIPPKNNP